MDGRKMSLVVMSILAVSAAMTFVAASSSASNTPLYTYRMEQTSSKMNFLPTAMNPFAYTTEKGYQLNIDIAGCCSISNQPSTEEETCETCDPGEYTCSSHTCWSTCLLVHTCQSTCWHTCPNTCSTCGFTCGGYTCKQTCEEPTCPWTCQTCEAC
jgi:hypothetical protein